MSMNNYILNLLNIEDKNIFILPNIKEKIIKNKKYKIIEGFLTYNPDCCPCCGCINILITISLNGAIEKIVR